MTAQSENLSQEKRGSFEGAIRIPLRSPLFIFNDLMFLRIPRKSADFQLLIEYAKRCADDLRIAGKPAQFLPSVTSSSSDNDG